MLKDITPSATNCDPPIGTVSEPLDDHLIASRKYGKISEFNEEKPIAALYLLRNDFFGQKQCCVEYHDDK